MKEAVIVRKALETDIDGMIPVWKQFIELHANLDPRLGKSSHAEDKFRGMVEEMFADKDANVFIALSGNSVCGFVFTAIRHDDPVFPDPLFGYIDILAVDEKRQRHGIGEMLYQEAVNWFKERGISHIELFIVPKNSMASSFWEKMGFSSYLELLYKKIEK